jgi:hypothetical protein
MKIGGLFRSLLLLGGRSLEPYFQIGYQVGLVAPRLSSTLIISSSHPRLTFFLLSSSRRVIYSTLTCVSSKFWSCIRVSVISVALYVHEHDHVTHSQLDLAHQRSNLFRLTRDLGLGFRVRRYIRPKSVSSENPWTSETS